MSRKVWSGLGAALLLAGLFPAVGSSAEESQPARLLVVRGVEQARGTTLEVVASGPFSFTSYQPNGRSLVVDLAGVASNSAAVPAAAPVAWVATYRWLPFRNASGHPVLRLDLALDRDCEIRLSQPSESVLWLTCPGVAPSTVASPPPAASAGEPTRVRQVSVEESEDQVTVEVKASAPLGYEIFTLTQPVRLVVDLPQSILVTGKQQVSVAAKKVTGVRVAQFQVQPPITRLVVDLQEMVPYEISSTPEGLRLTLLPGGPRALLPIPPQEASRVAAVPPAPPTPESEEPALPQESEEVVAQPVPTLVASLAPTLPVSGAGSSQEATPPEPVEMARAATPASTPTPTPATVPPQRPVASRPQSMLSPTAESTEYTGARISLNLKRADLLDFFHLIHEISGLNIVVDPTISGSVTLVLIDVPWDQALDIVLRNNGLSSTLEGNVLRITTRETLKQEQEQERELAQARAEAVEPVMRSYQLSYAQASDLEPTLQRFLSSRGEIIRDDRTNTLIIRDIPQVIPPIESLINQLDRKSPQVEIEARVVSASRSFARAIGSQFAFAAATGSRRSVIGGGLGEAFPFTSSTPVPPPLVSSEEEGAQPLVSSFPIAASSALLFGNRFDDVALDIILSAAESRNIAKVLSRPRLITQNNQMADVRQGTRIPVQTVVNNTISTTFLDVVLALEVTPQITAEGTVFLSIHIENTTIDPGIARINGIPALATQSTTTQVLVADGGTVVIGGIMITNNSTTINQVPLLGSIPIIGFLFKSTEVATSTTELLFFITPRILQM
ncbi:MAG: type IV pilus secretin PilQ [Candidatus Acidoferrales bacterium]